MFPINRTAIPSIRMLCSIRTLSSSSRPQIDVTQDTDGFAVMTMQKPPVNSLDLNFVTQMKETFDDLAKNNSRGVVLTSASPTVFSAGMDLKETLKLIKDEPRARQFFSVWQDMWLSLFGSPYPVAAAINGHAPAGGCMLALSSEHRVMVDGGFTIGLNEVAIGMVPTTWFIDSMVHVMSARQTELALTTGRMFSVEEALKVGLIDETASNKDECIEKCKKFLKTFDKVSPWARSNTKQKFRKDKIDNLLRTHQDNEDEFIKLIREPSLEKAVQEHLERLRNKSSNK